MLRLDAYINETLNLSSTAWVPKLNGSLVGNGFTDYKYDGKAAYVTMAYYHGLIDDELYDFLTQKCDVTYLSVRGTANMSADCKSAMTTFDKYTALVNMWDVFGKCWKSAPAGHSQAHSRYMAMHHSHHSVQVDTGLGDKIIPCLWAQPMVDYFNNATVKTALHVLPEVAQWNVCSFHGVSKFNYTRNETGTAWIYDQLRGKGYKMLFYSGDTDSIVPTYGTQQWINERGWNVTAEWRPYFIQNSPTTKQVAGYVEVRDDFTLVTVHGAGQLAAKQKRQQTFTAVNNFINGVAL